jgi:hypothetical protein
VNRVNIKEGVDRGLCGTCTFALIREDQHGQQTVLCQMDDRFIQKPLVACNKHDLTTSLNLGMMSALAWEINPEKGNKMGFISPKDRNG